MNLREEHTAFVAIATGENISLSAADLADEQDRLSKLLRKMRTTRECRYRGANRLEKLQRLSTYSICALSFYLVLISIAMAISQISTSLTTNEQVGTTFLSISMSIFVIIISLIENYKNYSVRADDLRRCAEAISMLINRYEVSSKADKEALFQLYQDILNRSRFSHGNIDLWSALLSHPDLNSKPDEMKKIRQNYFRNAIRAYWIQFPLSVILPPLLFFSLIWLIE
jgi:hypothetical protein